jgi:hypothetical protein
MCYGGEQVGDLSIVGYSRGWEIPTDVEMLMLHRKELLRNRKGFHPTRSSSIH